MAIDLESDFVPTRATRLISMLVAVAARGSSRSMERALLAVARFEFRLDTTGVYRTCVHAQMCMHMYIYSDFTYMHL